MGREKTEETSWDFTPGDEIVTGFRAWALLGDGRRCETWLAWCTRRWAAVALKLPRPDRVSGVARETLVREADRVGGLSHPGVQRLLEARLDEPLPHLVFEYVEGPSLAGLLDERGSLAPGDAVRLGLQVGSILHYLHGEGLVHLDVKPDNLVLRDGRVVLLDFDLARRVGEGDGDGVPRGSPPYMAPEQVRCEPAAPVMDLYALGATLYEAACGFAPFDPDEQDDEPGEENRGDETGEADAAVEDHGDEAEEADAHSKGGNDASVDSEYPQLHAPPLPLRERKPELPQALGLAIDALLAPDPRDRPATTAAALALLAAALPEGQGSLWPAWVERLLVAGPDQEPGRARLRPPIVA